jgi:hypothetical protein
MGVNFALDLETGCTVIGFLDPSNLFMLRAEPVQEQIETDLVETFDPEVNADGLTHRVVKPKAPVEAEAVEEDDREHLELLANEEEYEEPEDEGIMSYTPFRQLAFLGMLFFGPKFFVFIAF